MPRAVLNMSNMEVPQRLLKGGTMFFRQARSNSIYQLVPLHRQLLPQHGAGFGVSGCWEHCVGHELQNRVCLTDAYA